MTTTDMSTPFVITLEHEGAEPHVLTFDQRAATDDAWLERVLFLPLMPQRLIGFVHPAVDAHVGSKPFVLHAAHAFYSSIAMQPVEPSAMKVIRGPQVIVPYDMISPIDIWIGTCASWVWVRKQSPEWKDAMRTLLLRNLQPPIEAQSPPRRARRRPVRS